MKACQYKNNPFEQSSYVRYYHSLWWIVLSGFFQNWRKISWKLRGIKIWLFCQNWFEPILFNVRYPREKKDRDKSCRAGAVNERNRIHFLAYKTQTQFWWHVSWQVSKYIFCSYLWKLLISSKQTLEIKSKYLWHIT